MNSWTKTYPKSVSKNDLRNVKLHIFADCPPQPTNKNGIFSLKVMTSEAAIYLVRVTQTDINHIIDADEAGKAFKFDDTKPWAEVVPYD
jgi:hypothetical protein